LRLAFKKGVTVEPGKLPKAFLPPGTSTRDWVPFEILTPAGKRWALESLFPDDAWHKDGVRHKVRWPDLESVWLISALFTGHGQNYDRLQAVNPGLPEKPRAGDTWIIPAALLSVELGGRGPGRAERHPQPEDDLDDEGKVAAYRALLGFESDRVGKVAVYHLRKGEALYSSVVMRYTDRVDPASVNEMALEIARRSGIADVRSIQPGQAVRIPVEALSAPFQPEGTEALAEEREVREEVRRIPRLEAGPRLKGVRIVLDAGHGGVDQGASGNGIWESDFVYDITMRVQRLLDRETDAKVSATIRYPGPRIRDAIPAPTREAEILTTPPFPNDGESPNAVSVHLRWVEANDAFAAFAARGDAQKTLFISFHADSLHPSARGTMVYVPGAAGVPAAFVFPTARAPRVSELHRGGAVHFTARERLQGEARSRLFAETLLKALKSEDITVHDDRPIRNIIRRGRASFVPAVIRYNTAATKVLVEVLNLTNSDDAENLKDPAFRERYAVAVVKGIRNYYRGDM
jgi:N-acetylmuramoyl-L-alanine amidase